MEFWAGENGKSSIRDIKYENVMDSVYPYLYKENPEIKYKYRNLFLDNGAYSIFKNNYNKRKKKVKLNLDSIINIQEKFNPKYTVPFDYPLNQNMNRNIMEKKWKQTLENIDYWDNSTNLNIVPALHGWNKTSLTNNLNILHKKNFYYIALGSTFILDTSFKGYFGDRQPNKSIYEAFIYLASLGKKINVDFHIFGLGSSPLAYHLAAYCEIKSSDSSGYRRKAAFGKIILPHTGERYAGNGKATFGVNRNRKLSYENIFSIDDKEKLKNCACPECRKISKHGYRRWKHLCSDWTVRAKHNKWVMEQEEKTAQKMITEGWDVYEKFIDKIMEKSSLKYLWNHIKNVKKLYF